MRVLGIDPGSITTGYGIIEMAGSKAIMVEAGYLSLAKAELPVRLGEIYTRITEIIREFDPDVCAIEQVFFAKNAKSALTLGQARGAAICAAVNSHLPVSEYSAKQIKQAVVGTGGADKTQVQYMMKLIFGLTETPQSDMADALACAMCHMQNAKAKATILGKYA